MKFTPTQVNAANDMIHVIENPDNIGPREFGEKLERLAFSLGGVRSLTSMAPEGIPLYLLSLIVSSAK